MTHIAYGAVICTNEGFEAAYARKVASMLAHPPVNRGPAHATKDESMASTHELLYLSETFEPGQYIGAAQSLFQPNLPWAEDHFQERISGQALNPAPSEAWWPFARRGNAEHKKLELFSHTYPERFWPKRAGHLGQTLDFERMGIRFPYGDLDDVVAILRENINSRQAYLPIWFPEDLGAARQGERVPCSMGYHFLTRGSELDCVYTLRSCDIVRFYRDDMYMAARLLQHVAERLSVKVGRLVVHIDNLHCFPGDRPFLEQYLPKGEVQDKRAGYNWSALA